MKFRRPPTLKTADDFISGAGTPVKAGQGADVASVAATSPSLPTRQGDAPTASARDAREEAVVWPWEGRRADKQTEVFNLRLSEVELEKLRFISANTPDSMQAFVRKVLVPALEAKINEMI